MWFGCLFKLQLGNLHRNIWCWGERVRQERKQNPVFSTQYFYVTHTLKVDMGHLGEYLHLRSFFVYKCHYRWKDSPGTVGDQSIAKPSVMCPEKLKRAVASFCCFMKAVMAVELWTASTWGPRSNISTCPFSDQTAANDCSPRRVTWKPRSKIQSMGKHREMTSPDTEDVMDSFL